MCRLLRCQGYSNSKRLHTLWSVKYCAKASVNHFLWTCKILQVSKICSEMKNNTMLETVKGYIIIDIKTQNGWLTWVKCLNEKKSEKANMAKKLKRKDTNDYWANITFVWYHSNYLKDSVSPVKWHFQTLQSLCSGQG